MSEYIPAKLRRQVVDRDRNRCAYCQTSEINSGIPLSVDHVFPVAQGGQTVLDNICLACRTCNEAKGKRTDGIDPLSGGRFLLFDPIREGWDEHFVWGADGVEVRGKTAIGRVTVEVLRMNNPVIRAARRRWVLSGWHPPDRL
jgi:hypothetical protein